MVGEHAYVVTFKSETGMCMTYTDASCVETQSYDKDGDEWVYNSEDKSIFPMYLHPITIYDPNHFSLSLIVLNNDVTPFTKETLVNYIKSLGNARFLLTGSIYEETYYLAPAYLLLHNNNLYVVGIDSTGTSHSQTLNTINFETYINPSSVSFYDGVNKIN